MLHIILAVMAVLLVAGVAVAYLVLVVSDVRRSGEPLDPDGRRSLDAHEQRDAQRRINRGARGGTW